MVCGEGPSCLHDAVFIMKQFTLHHAILIMKQFFLFSEDVCIVC